MVAWHDEQKYLAAFSLLGFVACYATVIMSWLFKAMNVGCILFAFFVGTPCLIQFVNIMLWWDNTDNKAPVWCDITTRFYFMSSIGMMSSALVIARRLCLITSATTAQITPQERTRATIIDLVIGLSPPLAQLVIFWFIQGHRFDILEGFGCYPAVPATWLAILLNGSWPVVIGMISGSYSVFTITAILKRRMEIARALSFNNLTFGVYYRLLAIAIVNALLMVPLGIFFLVTTKVQYHYRGLADLHIGFSRVGQIPLLAWGGTKFQQLVEMSSWAFVGLSLMFFCLFGLATQGATRRYSSAYNTIARKIGLPTLSYGVSVPSSSADKTASIYFNKHPIRTRGTGTTFSTSSSTFHNGAPIPITPLDDIDLSGRYTLVTFPVGAEGLQSLPGRPSSVFTAGKQDEAEKHDIELGDMKDRKGTFMDMDEQGHAI